MAIYLKTKIGSLMVISTYWPYDSNPDGNGLAAGIGRWMAKCKRNGTCMEYIQDRIHKLIMNQQSNSSNATIVCGDFNACYHKFLGKVLKPRKGAKFQTRETEVVVDKAPEKNDNPSESEQTTPAAQMNKKAPSKPFKKN